MLLKVVEETSVATKCYEKGLPVLAARHDEKAVLTVPSINVFSWTIILLSLIDIFLFLNVFFLDI